MRLEVLEKASRFITEDLLYLSNMREGRRKDQFFSSTYIEGTVSAAIEDVLKERGEKLSKKNRSVFITKAALEKVKNNDMSNLITEHIVCKNVYYDEIKQLVSDKTITWEKVFEILSKYYLTALVTKSEDLKLDAFGLRSKMVSEGEWNKEDVFSRYKETNINLIENPYSIL